MNQQCGNCKWWQLDNTIAWSTRGICQAPVPACVNVVFKRITNEWDGKTCQVYNEHKEHDTVEDLPEFLKRQAD